MSFKTIFLVLVILLCGAFILLKVLVLGDPGSTFNQGKRLELGKYPTARLILGLRDYGDARVEYFYGSGPIAIKWYRPQLEEIDQTALGDFAKLIRKYTGREVKVVYGGVIDDGVIDKHSGLRSVKLFGADFDQTNLFVYYTNDYKPRDQSELASTYQESGIIVSLNSHKNFLSARPEKLRNYTLSSLLHEFGHQLGLEHNQDPSCAMAEHAGEGDGILRVATGYTPLDFCEEEAEQIKQMKLKFAN